MCKCSQSTEAAKVDYQYAAKIVCGSIQKQSKQQPLPIGEYKTKINIHNPSRCDCVTFRWKVAVGFPHLETGPVSDFSDATLCADEALEIDYTDIKRKVRGDMEHIEGWVVIESPIELDIVAVYGTTATKNGTVNAFHTERVQPRCLAVCDDFHLDISTGVSAWQVNQPSQTNIFNTAILSQPDPAWAGAQPGSIWVRPVTEAAGDYTYKLEFKLCSGFRNPNLNMSLLADDFIKSVSLNGKQILSSQSPGPNYNITPIVCSATQFFKTGMNVLLITVHNSGKRKNPTGLNIHGFMEVANGLCAGEAYPLLACPGICYQVYDAYCTFNPFIGFVIYKDASLQSPVCNGSTIGTTGGFRRIEQLGVSLTGSIPPGTYIEYRVFTQHMTSSGWSAWTASGLCGTTGANAPITAIEIRLVNAPVNCHVRYSIWQRKNLVIPMGGSQQSIYYYDGATAGDAAGSFPYHRIEAVSIEIV